MGNKQAKSSRTITRSASDSTSYDQQQHEYANSGVSEGSASASYGYGQQSDASYGQQQQLGYGHFPGSDNFRNSISASASSYGQQRTDFSDHRCQHYRRKCMIKAPCCDQVFQCSRCHDEAMNSLAVDPTDRHTLPRHQVKRVICCRCNTEQNVRQYCKKCGVCMGKYFCAKCILFDDDVSKGQFHCDGCGICRTGGEYNYFHCDTCGCCYSKQLRYTHRCLEGAMHTDCPICCEDLFSSRKDTTQLPCGHMMHLECKIAMEQHSYKCPICSRSIHDMSETWRQYDQEMAQSNEPEDSFWSMQGGFTNVRILCNDCGERSQVRVPRYEDRFKCNRCNSYNTRLI